VQLDKVSIKATSKDVGVTKVTYDTQALVYALSSPVTLNGRSNPLQHFGLEPEHGDMIIDVDRYH